MKIFTKIIATIIILIYIGIFMLILFNKETPPEHPLDFTDNTQYKIDKKITSIEDGLPYAVEHALKWREDAKLTSVEVIYNSQAEGGQKTKIIYDFEFSFKDKNKCSGIMEVFLDIQTNSIDAIYTSHDGELNYRGVNKIKYGNLSEMCDKVYKFGLDTIGEENIYENEIIIINIKDDIGVFEVRTPNNGVNTTKTYVEVDLYTFKVIYKK